VIRRIEMASVKMSRGAVQLSYGMDGDSKEPIIVVSAQMSPRIHLGKGHQYPVPMAESDLRFTERDFSPEGAAAIKTILAEIEAMVRNKIKDKVSQFSAETGIKVE
jgi:hypothetical protein